jgi:transcriptional regulator with XRE-family HTH domain
LSLQQRELASRAGVTVGTIRRFEQTGRASMESVIRIAHALRAEEAIERLFAEPQYATLDAALAAPQAAERQRVRRRR